MEKIEVLFGFNDNVFEDAVKEKLASRGYDAHIVSRFSKASVLEYVEKNPACNTVILKEVCSKDMVYTAEEVARLTDSRDVNVIIVLNARHYGTDYVKTLYVAGITGALFQKGRSGGVTVKEIVSMILERKSKKDARDYYGIAGQKIDVGYLDIDVYVDYYREMKEGVGTLLENYLLVCSKMSPQQIADFTNRLPKNEKDELVQFEEFHTVMLFLKKFGYDMKFKKPRRARVGLVEPIAITANEERIVIDKPVAGKKEPVDGTLNTVTERVEPVEETVKEEIKEEVKEQEVSAENSAGGAASFADMLMGAKKETAEPMSFADMLTAAGIAEQEKEAEEEAAEAPADAGVGLADLLSAFASKETEEKPQEEPLEESVSEAVAEVMEEVPEESIGEDAKKAAEEAERRAEEERLRKEQEAREKQEREEAERERREREKQLKEEEKARKEEQKRAQKEEKERERARKKEAKEQEKIRLAEERAAAEDRARHEQKYGEDTIPDEGEYEEEDEYDGIYLDSGESSGFPLGIIFLMVLAVIAVAAYLYISRLQ